MMEHTDFNWAEQMNCAVTVCDAGGVIVYMNEHRRKSAICLPRAKAMPTRSVKMASGK